MLQNAKIDGGPGVTGGNNGYKSWVTSGNIYR